MGCASSIGVHPQKNGPQRQLSSVDERCAALAASRIPYYLSTDEVRTLCSYADLMSFPSRHCVFPKGSPVDSLYVVCRGTLQLEDVKVVPPPALRVERKSTQLARSPLRLLQEDVMLSDTKDRDTQTFLPGDILDESVIQAAPGTHERRCVAPQDACCLVWTKRKLTQFLQTVPAAEERLREALTTVEEHLAVMHTFDELPHEKRRMIASLFRFKQVGAGQCLFQQDDYDREYGNSLYLLLRGECNAIVRLEHEAQPRTSKIKQRGEFIGEAGVMLDIPRTASVVCADDGGCVFLELMQSDFRTLMYSVPELFQLFSDRIAKYNITLHSFIHNAIFLGFFQEYCTKEFSQENVNFWVEAHDFRRFEDRVMEQRSRSQLREQAHAIQRKYIGKDAVHQINLASSIEERILDAIAHGDVSPTLFRDAEDAILDLMARDSFVRFKASPLYAQCLESINSPWTAVLKRLFLI